MRNIFKALGILAIVLLGFTPAHAGFSLSIGTNNSYLSVGDYDYLPYTVASSSYGAPRVNFYDVMGQYGGWVNESRFGRVWRPYVAADWRPYTQGHWIYTQYGPTWVGYEPWAWAAYHYGNWIFTQGYGWVWVPGYDWHPGRVMWSHSYGSIGWSPAPPDGYDYSQGYLSYRGNDNQYNYDDNDFDRDDYNGYGYDNRGYYNSNYQQIAPQIWVFIQAGNFNSDNYNNCYFGGSYAQQVFQNRVVRVTDRSLPRVFVEKNTHQQIREIGVHVKEMQADNHNIKMVIPDGEEDVVRRHANDTVKQVIAPAFAEKQKEFRGTSSKNQSELARVFKQDNSKQQIERISSDQLLNQVKQQTQENDRRRGQDEQKQIDTIVKMKKQTAVQPNDNIKNNDNKNRDLNPGGNQNQEPLKKNRDAQFDHQTGNLDSNVQIEKNNNRENNNQQFQIDQQRLDQKRIEQQQQEQLQFKQQDKIRQDRLEQEKIQQDRLNQDKINQQRYEQQLQDQKNNNRDNQFRSRNYDQTPPVIDSSNDQQYKKHSDQTVVDRNTNNDQDGSQVQTNKQQDSTQNQNHSKNNDKKKDKKHHQDGDPQR